jgi:hypothetical protein
MCVHFLVRPSCACEWECSSCAFNSMYIAYEHASVPWTAEGQGHRCVGCVHRCVPSVLAALQQRFQGRQHLGHRYRQRPVCVCTCACTVCVCECVCVCVCVRERERERECETSACRPNIPAQLICPISTRTLNTHAHDHTFKVVHKHKLCTSNTQKHLANRHAFTCLLTLFCDLIH